jgi:hypothetical protein
MRKIEHASDARKDSIDFELVFKQLNEELSSISQSLELVCAGGYVMQQHGYRATADVDAFYNSNKQIESTIRKVGDEFSINKDDELWLNNSISNMNDLPPDEHCEIVYSFSNLVVKAVDILYLVGMKMSSPRNQDLKDVAVIIRVENIKQPFALRSQLEDIGFNVDISDLLEVFGIAYGIDWLKIFYEDNYDEISKG